MSKNLKTFEFSTKTDYIIYLGELIIAAYKSVKTLKRYIKELDEEIDKKGLRVNPGINIPSEDYIDFNNKFSGEEGRLINLIGDLSENAISYYRFRKLIEKSKKSGKDFGIDDLPPHINEALKQTNISRNWSLHIPESLLNARIELFNNRVESGEHEVYPLNPIVIADFNKYEGEWLISLYNEKKRNLDISIAVLSQMKKDYSKLLGQDMRIYKNYIDVRDAEDMDIAKLSFDIQNKKYTNEK